MRGGVEGRLMAKPANVQSLGEWVRATRVSQGISQRTLAERSGLSRSYLCDIERGRGAQPSVTTLDKLANALGAARTDLLRVSGILQSAAKPGDERERRLLAVYRDLERTDQDAVERFARFLQAEKYRWVQAQLIDGGVEIPAGSLAPIGGPTLFDGLDGFND
jgi:transcriptional regulator with XRE-family HTH domain